MVNKMSVTLKKLGLGLPVLLYEIFLTEMIFELETGCCEISSRTKFFPSNV